jgi:hypothetical protein
MRFSSQCTIKKHLVGGRVVFSHLKHGAVLRLVQHINTAKRVIASRGGTGGSVGRAADTSVFSDLKTPKAKTERRAQTCKPTTDDTDDLLSQMQASFRAHAGKRRVVKLR